MSIRLKEVEFQVTPEVMREIESGIRRWIGVPSDISDDRVYYLIVGTKTEAGWVSDVKEIRLGVTKMDLTFEVKGVHHVPFAPGWLFISFGSDELPW